MDAYGAAKCNLFRPMGPHHVGILPSGECSSWCLWRLGAAMEGWATPTMGFTKAACSQYASARTPFQASDHNHCPVVLIGVQADVATEGRVEMNLS